MGRIKSTSLMMQPMLALLVFFVLLFGPNKADPQIEENPCPVGWVQATWVDMGCLYFNNTHNFTWIEANAYCQGDLNATLVEITTEEQYDFIKMELQVLEVETNSKLYWWTGGTDLGREGKWFWTGSLRSVGSFIWSKDQPNDGIGGNCLNLYPSSGYEGSDKSCVHDFYPICQII